MSEKKTFLAPVYIMAFSFLIGAVLEWPAFLSYVSLVKLSPGSEESLSYSLKAYWINRLINIGIFCVIILIESFVYWRIRKRKYRKDFAIGHAVGIALTLAVLPAGFAIAQSFIDLSVASEETTDTIRTMNILYGGLLRVFFIMAHVCFALVLISVWKNRKNRSGDVVPGEKDILNEYADR
jgi:heme/copper-type cytochrome/quinol oxidase subunit 2